MVISITKPTGKAHPVVHAGAGNPFFYTAWDPGGLKREGTWPEYRGKKWEEEREKSRVKIRTGCHWYDRNSNWEKKGEDGGWLSTGELEVNEKNTGNGDMFGWVGDKEERGPLDWSLADETLKEGRKVGINLEKESTVTMRQSGKKCREENLAGVTHKFKIQECLGC